jgi:hypothetical protein
MSLRANVFCEVKELDRTVQMLVLDDEADDGSILDAVVESSQDPIYGKLKQIPRSIANLWDPPQGAPENLFSTYIAYTATPQANLLQEDHNPLAPRDFLISLRTPLEVGRFVPSSPTRPSSGRSPRIISAMSDSAARSISVTMSVAEDFVSTVNPPRRSPSTRRWAAFSAVRVARSSNSAGDGLGAAIGIW